MREYVGIAFNETLVPINGKLSARAELIVLTSEMEYLPDGGGDITRRRDISNFRFLTSAKGLRRLASALTEYAAELEKLEKDWRPAKEKESPADERDRRGSGA